MITSLQRWRHIMHYKTLEIPNYRCNDGDRGSELGDFPDGTRFPVRCYVTSLQPNQATRYAPGWRWAFNGSAAGTFGRYLDISRCAESLTMSPGSSHSSHCLALTVVQVNRRWKNMIDGDEATGQPPSALFQGMMAAAFTQLSSPSATDTSHPGHDYRRVIARNAAWMHRDFAAALRSAIDGSHDLRQEPAFSFNVKALMFHLTGKKRWSADDLEPELHGGHLFMSLRSPGVLPRPDDFGILHVDLNKADPAVLRRFQSGQPATGVAGESADCADRLVGVCWRPWSEEPEAWGFSQARNEVIVVCAAYVAALIGPAVLTALS